jgi:hypothetical protein
MYEVQRAIGILGGLPLTMSAQPYAFSITRNARVRLEIRFRELENEYDLLMLDEVGHSVEQYFDRHNKY